MLDLRNGSFLAPVPSNWVTRTGPYTFRFFAGEQEFQPTEDASNTDADPTALRTVSFGPRICSGAHAVADAATGSVCGCVAGFAPDPRPPHSGAP
eukprot:COSAG01_NODE_51115_length_357_cov_1.007752_1_plen_94_part_01